MASDICLVCESAPKRQNYQFCSQKCTKEAASRAPELMRVPKGHVIHDNVTKLWSEKWHDSTTPCPSIAKIYLITWTAEMRTSFDAYREEVARKRNRADDKPKEIKCFRSERRACRLGDSKSYDSLCNNQNCRLCVAIKTSFGTSLDFKRQQVNSGAKDGIRFGGGIYMSASSNKAFEYAKNLKKGSEYLAVLVTRTVLGNIQILSAEDHTRMEPNKGYDSVKGRADGGGSLEYVVYDENAVRPAYLIMVKV
ncbi:uncharacterized protein EV420DRAFT_1684195 [Desarmillaria tabescens]|uniref:PARP catalytic domain-containing protein n=1 Tax=Armillaria tabescens TaxID=1929756 RepID=A0AA39NLB0_ARMTA|nr:uncharacterized protein EV420DRAFT_1684195 [Desarmillaria tabescens]KAK0467746.1 hypothetical protein EV420DRAFT_1684195 [Desarmillaria tabescens]